MLTRTKYRRTTRWAALAGATVMATAALTAVQLAAAAPASAATEILYVSASSPINSLSSKTARAYCPADRHVISGGAWLAEMNVNNPTRKLALTQLQPVRLLDGTRDGYVATGAEIASGTTGDWYVVSYAMCADKDALSDWEIVPSAPMSPSSLSVQTTSAVCTDGRRALGTGGSIGSAGGQVGLQVARASASGDIARVQAHEDADGYTGNWFVISYAICAQPPAGYQVVYGESPQRASEPEKVASAVCPGSKVVFGAGGAITNTAPGNASLRVVYPGYRHVDVIAMENTPTTQNWDFIVAQAICAY